MENWKNIIKSVDRWKWTKRLLGTTIKEDEEIFIEELNNMNLKIHRHTTGNKLSKLCDVYLVDSYGETLKFYDVSKIVFLGGSLINHGGQNPIEPARLGCKIFHGSNVQNFKEVYGYLNRLNISKKINFKIVFRKIQNFEIQNFGFF